MNLQQVLDSVGMNRSTYNAGASKGWFPYIERILGHFDQFGEEHVLAMAAHAALRNLGLDPQLTGMTIKASFSHILRVVKDEPLASEAYYFVGAKEMLDPKTGQTHHDYIGWPTSDWEGWPELGRVAVDLRVLRLQRQLSNADGEAA